MRDNGEKAKLKIKSYDVLFRRDAENPCSDASESRKVCLTVKLVLETLLQKLNKNITFGVAERQDLKNKFLQPRRNRF